MTEHIFDGLRDELRHAVQHFHLHGHSINSEQTQPATPQEPAMALADTANDLVTEHNALRANLETGAASLREALDNHAARIDSLLGDVAVIAKIADEPIVAAALGAAHVDPAILEGFVSGLSAIARAFPKPANPPAAEPSQEPQPEQQAA